MSEGVEASLFVAKKPLNMILKYSVGLDVSSKDLKASLCTIDEQQAIKVKSSGTFLNTKDGFAKLQQWISKHHKEQGRPLCICMEATGIYHEQCAYTLHGAGFRVSIILPTKAKRYLQSLGLKSKNDSIDAQGLAQMGAEQLLTAWEPMGTFYYDLRSLTRQHQNATEQATAAKNKLHAEMRGHQVNKMVVRHLKAAIKLFEKQEEELECAISGHIESDGEVARKVENICEIKGLAMLSVSTVLAECGGFILFQNRPQVVSYAGYDVVENQSGNHRGKTKISKRGNSRIRRILFMPAFSAVKNGEPVCFDLFNRTLERHGEKMKSYVAVQKKLLLLIYDLYTKDVPYDPQNYKKLQQGNDKINNEKVIEEKNIQEKELEPSSGVSRHKDAIKIAPNKVGATQGKHPTNDRSMPPLGTTKLQKKSEKILGF